MSFVYLVYVQSEKKDCEEGKVVKVYKSLKGATEEKDKFEKIRDQCFQEAKQYYQKKTMLGFSQAHQVQREYLEKYPEYKLIEADIFPKECWIVKKPLY
ncbi:MAG: hypothetical protein ACOC3V_01800 [bacterium]